MQIEKDESHSSILEERYVQGKQIGSGTYSNVFLAIDKVTKNQVALKIISINPAEGIPSTTLREISILKECKHQNIITMLNVIQKEDILIMVLEHMDYDLIDYFKMAYDNQFLVPYKIFLSQLIEGIYYIHKNNIVHRDLKPGNILIDKLNILKITDFGLARKLSGIDGHFSPEVITLWYRPPELLMGVTKYGSEVDIWSLGCIIYEIITRIPLLPGHTIDDQLRMCYSLDIESVVQSLKVKYNVPYYIIKIFKGCMNHVPSARMSIIEIRKIVKKHQK